MSNDRNHNNHSGNRDNDGNDSVLFVRNARVLTLRGGPGPRRGTELRCIEAIDGADVVVRDGIIDSVNVGLTPPAGARVIDASGRVLMPAFVDAHTHACWAGERLDEWEMKQRGATYLDILRAGGGIMSTVRAVRAASEDELAESLVRRLRWMLNEGTTAVEVKSGYGLSTKDELKMLRAIRKACRTMCDEGAGPAAGPCAVVVPTACIGHAIDTDVISFVDRTITETLPAVTEEFPGVTIDAYCEKGAWSLDDCIRLFEAARERGHPIRVHADQFNSLGMIPVALRLGAHSVDHLEASDPRELDALAGSGTFGVMLPASGFHVDGRYANARRFVDAGGALVIASNCNPGSAPTSSMPMIIALATRYLGLSAAEAITACTVNAAALLGLHERGRIEPGCRADLILLRHDDERQLGYEFGGNPVDMVIAGGAIVRDTQQPR